MSIHKSVLLKESIEGLNLKNGDIVVDATLGGGGHASEILERIGENGILVAIDLDIDAINRFKFPISNFSARGRSALGGQFPNNFQIPIFKYQNKILVNENFTELDKVLKVLKIKKVDAILADLGISSDQLENQKRGFSFQKDAQLDMRMDQEKKLTAEKIIDSYSEEDLTRIFREYGDEKYAKRISKKIVKRRKIKPVKTTLDLVSIISDSVPEDYKHYKINFATKVFQALRMEVNKELENLRCFIPKAIEVLNKGGRLAVIVFHSGEDKIVKEIFRENARGCICPPNFPICRCGIKPTVKLVNRKPVSPSLGEIGSNPRSRSAKLRIAEKL